MDEKTKRSFMWPLIALSCAPLLFIISFPKVVSTASVLLYLSALAGYVGVMFLLWMYMMGAKSAMGLIFKDLAPVLSIHKKLGKWGSIAFLLHPIFVAISYFEVSLYSLTYIVWPDISTSMERHVTLGRIAFYIIIGIWLTSKICRKKLGFRAWKYLHYFAYISLPFALLHVPELGTQYIGHELVRAYYWLIVGALALFSLVRVSGWLNLDRQTYIITSREQLTGQDFMFVLHPKSKQWLHPIAGQYVYLKIGYISEDHPFSVAYYNRNTGDITVVFRLEGNYTKYLAKLEQGYEVSVMGPFGTFTASMPADAAQPVVYIAGGVGITPFVQRILDEQNGRQQLLFAANRTHESAVLLPTLKKKLGNNLIAIYSREQAAGANEEYGHINEAIVRKYVADPLQHMYYVCGPKGFVNECRRVLSALGIPAEQIEVEKFSW